MAHDSTGITGDGDLIGNVSWGAGQAGSGLQLEGGYVDVPGTSAFDASGGFSVSAWICIDSSTDQRVFVGKHESGSENGWFLGQLGETLEFYVQGPWRLYTTDVYTDNTWHHVLGTCDGTVAALYVDGLFQTSATGPHTVDNSRSIAFGASMNDRDPSWGYLPATGGLDDVQMYSFALTAPQATYLFEHPGQALPEPGSLGLLALAASLALIRRRRSA